MKKLFLAATAILVNTLGFSQTAMISGKVNDAQGKPVPFAFVRDAQHNYATYTNNDGMFTLKADPASKLTASAANFKECTVPVDTKADVNIVLTANGSGTAALTPGKNFFQTNSNVPASASGSLYLRGGSEEVHGSRYLYDKWVHGYAVSTADSLIQSSDYVFNYDKIAGELLFTSDRQKVFIAEKGQVKGFTLFDDNAQPVTYELAPAVASRQFVQVLSSGPKYKIYKQVSTKFVKNNYTTNGITTSGNNYDEYVDEISYYVVKAGGQPQKLALKKKAIKEAFAADADKLNKYMAAQQGDFDENYLKDLGDNLNQ